MPANGEPYPDTDGLGASHSDGRPCDRDGVHTARILDAFLSTSGKNCDVAQLNRELAEHRLPIHRQVAIVEAIGRADPERVRGLARLLTRTSVEEAPTVLGMAMLAEVGSVEDVPLIQTVGLLSGTFGPLAARALARLPDAATNLIWLADRTAGWGRVYLVEAICDLHDSAAEPWLLRKACDGHHLNGYFAHQVARTARMHEAIARPDADTDLVDHTGRLLAILVGSFGMSDSILDYKHAERALAQYLSHVGRLEPNQGRCYAVRTLSEFLSGGAYIRPPDWASLDSLRAGYRSMATWPEPRSGNLPIWCG